MGQETVLHKKEFALVFKGVLSLAIRPIKYRGSAMHQVQSRYTAGHQALNTSAVRVSVKRTQSFVCNIFYSN
jgi:hypothetical protein